MNRLIATIALFALALGFALPMKAAVTNARFEPQLLWEGWCPRPMPVKASYTLKLEGLDGKESIEAATKLLKAIEGVETVTIDAETNIATITLKAGKTLTEDGLKAALKDSKYTFKEFAKAE